jgi:ADP-heptose:LPS heptosyltransferase
MSERILVIKTAAIGDCINALPAMRALRRALPRARLAWLVGRAAADAVIGQVPGVDWIVVDDATLVRRRPLALLSLARTLRARRFDAALVLHRAASVRFLARAAGARRRIGLVRSSSDRALLTEAVVDAPGVHEAERYWRAAEQMAHQPLDPDRQLWTPPAEAASRADALWAEWGWPPASRVVALAPGGGVNPRTRFDLKRWPLPKFIELTRRLAGREDRRVLVLGLPEELDAFREAAGPLPRVALAAGDLRLAGALLSRTEACIANDSGLMHLAVAAGVPTVAIFGPTNPDIWGPAYPGHQVVRHRVPCQPCYKDDGVLPVCDWEHRCLRDLSVDAVLSAVCALPARGGR